MARDRPVRLVRSVHDEPSALTYDCPARARGEMRPDGASTGTGSAQPGVVTRTATTNVSPAVTAAGSSRRTVWYPATERVPVAASGAAATPRRARATRTWYAVPGTGA